MSLMGTLDEKYLAPRAFGIMHNFSAWIFSGDELRRPDGALDLEWIRGRIGRVVRDNPILRQRLVPTPLRVTTPAWVTLPEVDLEHHVRRHPDVVADDPLHAEVFTGAGLPPMDPRRPLWDIHFVELSSGRIAMILRVHHAMGDAIVMVQVLLEMTRQDSADAESDLPEESAPGGLAILQSAASDWLGQYPPLVQAWREFWRKPVDRRIKRWARRLLNPLGSVDSSAQLPAPYSAYAEVDLAGARTIASGLGGSVNDLVVAATFLAVAEARPELAEISLLVPFSRGRPAAARNHVSAVPVTWRRGEDLADTVASVSAAMRSAFRDGVGSVGPATIGYATFVMWSRRPRQFGPAPIESLVGWPTVDPAAELGCLATGYAGRLVIGVKSASPAELSTMLRFIRSAVSTDASDVGAAGLRGGLTSESSG